MPKKPNHIVVDTRYLVGEEHPVDPKTAVELHKLPHPLNQEKAKAWLKRHRKKIRSRADIRVRWTNGHCDQVEKASIITYDYKPAAFK
jgi:hypothetical protein